MLSVQVLYLVESRLGCRLLVPVLLMPVLFVPVLFVSVLLVPVLLVPVLLVPVLLVFPSLLLLLRSPTRLFVRPHLTASLEVRLLFLSPRPDRSLCSLCFLCSLCSLSYFDSRWLTSRTMCIRVCIRSSTTITTCGLDRVMDRVMDIFLASAWSAVVHLCSWPGG